MYTHSPDPSKQYAILRKIRGSRDQAIPGYFAPKSKYPGYEVEALVQRGDSLIKPRQSQNRISGFSTESVLKPLFLFCDWRGLIKESSR